MASAVVAAGPALAALDVTAPRPIRQAAPPKFIYVYNWNKGEWVKVSLKKLRVADLKACNHDPEKLDAYLQAVSGGAA